MKGFPSIKKNVAITFFVILTAGAVFLIVEMPRYIVLDIPSPIAYLPNGDWYSISRTTRKVPDTYGYMYILRYEGRAYGKLGNYEFDSIENVLAYFDSHLTKDGWEITNSDPSLSCLYGLPEKRFINSDSSAMIKEYIPKGEKAFYSFESVCVLIEEDPTLQATEKRFNVVLVTKRVSPLTKFFTRSGDWGY